ncbi:MAG: hypothetical protein AB3N18_04635 [Allomuricauda sp.]
MKTIIHSNGSKWAGESPDSIDKLIELLKVYTIEERFFHQYTDQIMQGEIWIDVKRNLCPISIDDDGIIYQKGMHVFFGNFEEVSHVFRIETNNPDLIESLTNAIKCNKGWKKYYDKHLVKNKVDYTSLKTTQRVKEEPLQPTLF